MSNDVNIPKVGDLYQYGSTDEYLAKILFADDKTIYAEWYKHRSIWSTGNRNPYTLKDFHRFFTKYEEPVKTYIFWYKYDGKIKSKCHIDKDTIESLRKTKLDNSRLYSEVSEIQEVIKK